MDYLLASTIECVATHPIDVYKTRLQSRLSFSLKDSFRGLLFRGMGFVPTRVLFWWSQHNSPFQHFIPYTAFIAGVQSIADIPLDYWKIRKINRITTPVSFANIRNVAFIHFMRNWLFCMGLMSSVYALQKQQYYSDTLLQNTIHMSIGSTVGCIVSQPMDVLKTRYTSNMESFVFKFDGLTSRIAISSIGLGIGFVSLKLLEQRQ